MSKERATFAAGCFWGVEDVFLHTDGVTATTVGYTGGHTENPTYEQVCSGSTGHAEVVEVEFDTEKISYEGLLDVFWNLHDPTTLNRQGPDVGEQYRSAVFFHTPEQQKAAEKRKDELEASGKYDKDVVTEISKIGTFTPAEDYHQEYFHKNGKHTCKL